MHGTSLLSTPDQFEPVLLPKATLFIYLMFSLLVKKFEFPAQSSVLTKANKLKCLEYQVNQQFKSKTFMITKNGARLFYGISY